MSDSSRERNAVKNYLLKQDWLDFPEYRAAYMILKHLNFLERRVRP